MAVIFRNGLHHKVMAGAKSETRRPVKRRKGELVECRYQPGQDYAIHAKPKSPQVGRISIVAVERQRLGDITPESVKREGHKSLEEFKEAWLEAHDLKRWNPDKEVWAIVFEPFTDVVRLPAARFGDDRGYAKDDRLGVDRELSESPPDEVVADFAKRNMERHRGLHQEEQTRATMRSVTARLRQHVIAELKAGRDPSGVLRAVEEQLEGERRREAA